MTVKEQFESRIVPVMDRVRNDLQRRQAEEVRRYMQSPAYLLSGGSGPDGGMGAQAIILDKIHTTGQWNSKRVEDYVEMVRAELAKEGITVTPEMEEMMIDKMAKDRMPQSSIDYIIRKAAGNTVFGLPQEARKSPLQREIEQRSETLYAPSAVEKGIGWGLGAAADFVTLGGLSGGVAGGLKFVGADLAINAVMDSVQTKRPAVPSVVLPGNEKEWLEMNRQEEIPAKEERQVPNKDETVRQQREKKPEIRPKKNELQEVSINANKLETELEEKPIQAPQQNEKDNTGGWQAILSTLGLNGISDIGRNAGYILAMLPDILFGMFTGRTSSLGLKDNLVPLASIMAGLFVKNPLLKMTLIGLGGANLINKAGHEQLARREGSLAEAPAPVRYRQYEDEPMNPRIRDAKIQGSTLIATMDGIPVAVALPGKVVDAYRQGALPIGKLANAVLERSDRLQELTSAQERFEQESRTETRGIAQR